MYNAYLNEIFVSKLAVCIVQYLLTYSLSWISSKQVKHVPIRLSFFSFAGATNFGCGVVQITNFVVKFTLNGTCLASTTFHIQEFPFSATDTTGNLYVTGINQDWFKCGAQNITTHGSYDSLIAGLDSSLNCKWCKSIGGNIYLIVCY